MALVSLLGSFGFLLCCGFRFRGSKTKKKVVDQSLSLFFVDSLEVFPYGFLDLVWFSSFLVGGCLWVPGFLIVYGD